MFCGWRLMPFADRLLLFCYCWFTDYMVCGIYYWGRFCELIDVVMIYFFQISSIFASLRFYELIQFNVTLYSSSTSSTIWFHNPPQTYLQTAIYNHKLNSRKRAKQRNCLSGSFAGKLFHRQECAITHKISAWKLLFCCEFFPPFPAYFHCSE